MPETVIIFQTFGRREIACQSLLSLLTATTNEDSVVVVTDATPVNEFDHDLLGLGPQEYIWSPGDTSLATSRNLGVSMALDKYVAKWLLFVEDDVLYHNNWYEQLIETATRLEGTISPLGLAYGVFSASPQAHKIDVDVFDNENNIFASEFGLRADQRLYSSAHYLSVGKFWDADLLGISSCQTGKINHRSTMRGYCGGSIGHLNLCSFVEGQESTHALSRDIGPAAFDKRPGGYKGIHTFVAQLNESSAVDSTERDGDISSKPTVSSVSVFKKRGPLFAMTEVIPGTRTRLRTRIRRALKVAASGLLKRKRNSH